MTKILLAAALVAAAQASHPSDRKAVWNEQVRRLELYNADVDAALQWLESQPFVDRGRIILSGVSYGGIQTLLFAEKAATRYYRRTELVPLRECGYRNVSFITFPPCIPETILDSAMPIYMQITSKNGPCFPGEIHFRGGPWIEILSCGSESIIGTSTLSPRDAATGQASGKRQHQPITITKEWGASSSQLFQSAVSHEEFGKVEIVFVQASAGNTNQVTRTITLSNAAIAVLERFAQESGGGKHHNKRSGEKISLTFEKISIQGVDSKSVFRDDWSL